MSNEEKIWQFLKKQGYNDFGTAGVMGNLYAESALDPQNLQNTFNTKLGLSDAEYTKKVDNGTYTNFVYDGAGYGLAQWTYWSLKDGLLSYSRKTGKSIGDIDLQLEYLVQNLTATKGCVEVLKTAKTVEQASTFVLLNFERPADQSKAIQMKRASYGQGFYDKYAGKKEVKNKMKYNDSNIPLQCFMRQSTWYKGSGNTEIKGILWHSTGANNPNLKRYVQPDDNDPKRTDLLRVLGVNTYKNDWNHITYQAGVHAWIGKLLNGDVTTVQVGPWEKKAWGCGSGPKGSCNNGWIQFEICEDGLNDPIYFNAVYKEAVELTAYLCKKYHLNPKGTVNYNGVNVPVILCHIDSNKLGLGSAHVDVLHWFPKFGKNMETVRNDVAALLAAEAPVTPPQNIIEEDDEDMTQEKFDEMMNTWLENKANINDDPAWSKDARLWAESNGFIAGDEKGRKMYKKFMTREEMITVLHRIMKAKGML